MIEKAYEKVKDVISLEDFQKRLDERIKEFNDLIDESASAALIIDELGRSEHKTDKISHVEIGKSTTLKVRVKSISEIRKFEKRTGGTGEVVNVDITDGTGNIKLVLWDGDVELVRSEKIKKNSMLKILNGYVKQGRYNIEISLGKNGIIIFE